MQLLLQGLILGFVIVLPGMSGGTVFVILGIYEDLVKDLVKLHFKPYLPLLLGSLIGIYTGGTAFALLFEVHRDPTAAFLLGCLLASIRAVLKRCPPTRSYKRLLAIASGLAAGYFMVGEPINLVTGGHDPGWILLLVGGALASAAMIIPGVPGSSVLIVMGIYDTILLYIKELNIVRLLIFGVGSLLGMVLLVKTLERIYAHHRGIISFFFAGLIAGSSRALIPYSIQFIDILTFTVGFAAVWWWSGKE